MVNVPIGISDLELSDDVVATRGNVIEPKIVALCPKEELVGGDVGKVPKQELVVTGVDHSRKVVYKVVERLVTYELSKLEEVD